MLSPDLAAMPCGADQPASETATTDEVRSRYILMGLAGIALLSVGLYIAGITVPYPLSNGLLTPHTTWPPLVNFSLVAGLRHGIVYGLLIAAYMVALRLAVRVPVRAVVVTSLIVAGSWLIFCGSLLRAYPGDSLDIFDYVFRGRMQALFGASPLATTPDAFQNQPWYAYLTWSNWVDAYGPLWEYPSALVARLVGLRHTPTLADYIIGYRLLAITLTTISAGILSSIMARRDRRQIPAALVAWLWNPVLVISVAVGAHNDGMMIMLMLLAVLAFQRERFTLGLVALGMAGHVKVTVLVLVPVFLVWLVRRRGLRPTLWASLRAVAIILPVSWLLYRHYGGWITLLRMVRERAILTYNSIANIVFDQLRIRGNWDETLARQFVIRGSSLGFLVAGGLLLLLLWRRSRTETDDGLLWRAGMWVILAYLLIGCFWFQSWYVVWVLALAALLPGDRFTQTVLPLFAAGALWSNVLTDFLNQDPAHHFQGPQIDLLMMGILLAPPVLALLVLAIQRMLIQRIGRPTVVPASAPFPNE